MDQHGPMMDLAVDQEFAKLVESVSNLTLNADPVADTSVLQRQ